MVPGFTTAAMTSKKAFVIIAIVCLKAILPPTGRKGEVDLNILSASLKDEESRSQK